ncbi:MAG: heme exporter protein CcmB [Balneolaceae bacterium]|nr:heme exporter protein CcmB [Balneolaceae bacterium]
MNLIKGITAVFKKDLQTELRSRFAINTVLAFVGAALLLILFSLNVDQLPPTPQSGIIWIIILFAALLSLSRSFIAETEKKTFNLLRLHSNAPDVFGGKLLYNFIFILCVNITTFVLYIFFLGLPVAAPFILFLTLILGTAGLSGITTMLAAIVSQADRKGAIFSVLSIPLLFPLILILVEATKTALFEGAIPAFWDNFWALVGFAGTTTTAGFLLFDYIWED